MKRPALASSQRNQIDWFMQITYTTWQLFIKNELQNHAAATAFYFLLSAAPLVLLLTYATQYLAHLAESSNLAGILLAALYERFSLDELSQLGFIPQKTQAAASGVGILTLLLSSRGLINALQSAFRVIFPDEGKRLFVVNWVLPLLIVPLVFVLVILAISLQAMLAFLLQGDWLSVGKARALQSANVGFALLALWGVIYLAYHRLPLTRPPKRTARLISALSTLTLVGLFLGFGHFFHIEKYQAVYGALGGVVFVLIGAYLAAIAFYFWAQLLYALAKVDIAALEKLFLKQGEVHGSSRLENLVFARANRLLSKYGRHFAAGEHLIREGDDSRDALFIHVGRVGIYKNLEQGEKKLAELETGNLIGEMAYLLDETRTASVRAETEVVALVLPPNILEDLMRYSAPLSRRIISNLAQRLMHMNRVTQT